MPRSRSDRLRIPGYLVVAAAVTFALVCLWDVVQWQRLRANGVPVLATIESFELQEVGAVPQRFVRYGFLLQGRRWRFAERDEPRRIEAFRSAHRDAQLQVGQAIPLLVDPAQPQQHRVDLGHPDVALAFWLQRAGVALLLAAMAWYLLRKTQPLRTPERPTSAWKQDPDGQLAVRIHAELPALAPLPPTTPVQRLGARISRVFVPAVGIVVRAVAEQKLARPGHGAVVWAGGAVRLAVDLHAQAGLQVREVRAQWAPAATVASAAGDVLAGARTLHLGRTMALQATFPVPSQARGPWLLRVTVTMADHPTWHRDVPVTVEARA